MRALVFGVDPEPWPDAPPGDGRLLGNLRTTPMALLDWPDPDLRGPDWLVLRTRLCGICGSDAKQVLMDFSDADDNPMTALISFPQVLGHEVVATVEAAGSGVADVQVGDRVVLNAWLGCRPRGIDPPCPACRAGQFPLCHNFTAGDLAPGIHTGNSADATGGFAELLPAHRSMVTPVPDALTDEVAVLADPFAVSLHAVLHSPPPEGGRVLVYGAGALGLGTVAILRSLYPTVDVVAVARWPAQAEQAERQGATVVDPDPEGVIDHLARTAGTVRLDPWGGLPVLHPGAVDVVYDTVGSPQTVEVGIRVLRARGTLSLTGVSSPGRFEWTPWYFKELRLVGSNAFGIEEVDGVRRGGIDHYLDLAVSGRIDGSAMLTHRFGLDRWRDAFVALADQGASGAVKTAFDFR